MWHLSDAYIHKKVCSFFHLNRSLHVGAQKGKSMYGRRRPKQEKNQVGEKFERLRIHMIHRTEDKNHKNFEVAYELMIGTVHEMM